MNNGAKIKWGGKFFVYCYDKNGNMKWRAIAKNIVPNAALNHILDVYFPSGGASAPANMYIGLTDGTPTVTADDTMASHPGWTEVTAYSEASRQAYVDVRTNQTVSNAASKASFSINADNTVIGGLFLTTDNTKGGAIGLLVAAAAFDGGNRTAFNGDTLKAQYDFTAADDGV